MHPVIRILSALTLLAYLSRADWRGLLVIAALLGVAYSVARVRNFGKLARMLLRLRYFLIAIVLVYGVSTPGAPVADLWLLSLLSVQGLLSGIERASGLVVIVAVVHWLLETTHRDELAAALYWLLRPLAWMGLPVERFVLRLVLTLERIEAMLDHTRRARSAASGERDREGIMARVGRLFEHALKQAEAERGIVVHLSLTAQPGWGQWVGWLIFVAGLLVMNELGMRA